VTVRVVWACAPRLWHSKNASRADRKMCFISIVIYGNDAPSIGTA
jgi:hypothetical protein